MRIEKRNLHQDAVLWKAYGVDEHGTVTVEPPEEIKCRWETVKRESVTTQGDTVSISAEVWVDREIPNSSIMRLGTLNDLSSEPDELMQVISQDKTPDIKGRTYQLSVSLMRYSNTLPDQVGTST